MINRILSIETSCDETAVCVLSVNADCDVQIEYEMLASQVDLHKQYGGVVPELAAREHIKALALLLDDVGKQIPDIGEVVDAIAVTSGPGLKGCLLMGVNAARGLAAAWQKPIMGINHIEGHLYSAFLRQEYRPEYPFISLIASGGHTELILVQALGDYRVLAKTIDDAAGEAFDKSAFLLGFDYPGGAALANEAQSVQSTRFTLPKAMRGKEGFSFSGLKTAISLMIKKNKGEVMMHRAEACYAIEQAIVESLVEKTKIALEEYHVKQFVLGGGVAANKVLRERLSVLMESKKIQFCIPHFKHCTDNAAMIGLSAGLRLAMKNVAQDLRVRPRWPLEEIQI